ncbi:MAG: FkbM family methyltransferase [Verrucomicrobiales bacterium]
MSAAAIIRKRVHQLESYFPQIDEMKERLQISFRRALSIPFEPDFQVLKHFPAEPGAAYIDVGANRGQTIRTIQMYHPEVVIHAFEPNLLLSARTRDVFDHCPNVNVYSYGLGASEGTFTLHVPQYRKKVFDSLASFDQRHAREYLEKYVDGFDEECLHFAEMECKVKPMDSLKLRPSFIKIDVEGAEDQVLAGGSETLAASEPGLLIEGLHNNAKALEILKDLHFEIYTLQKDKLVKGQRVCQNTFAFTPGRRAQLPESLFAD